MDGEGSSQSTDAVGACAEFIHGFFGSFVNAWVADQPKVAVGSVHAHHTSAHAHFGSTHHLFHGLIIKIQIIALEVLNAVGHRLDAAGDGVICIVKIHVKASETEWRKFSLGGGFCLADGGWLLAFSSQPANFLNSASSITFTPRDCALSNLEPGFSPRTR